MVYFCIKNNNMSASCGVQYDEGLEISAKMNKMKINREISKYNKRNETVEEKKKTLNISMTITVKKTYMCNLRLCFLLPSIQIQKHRNH